MGNVNRGKEFENVIREAFKRVPETMVTRLPDPVQGYLGYRNICDFLIYHYPNFYCIECKSVHGNTMPLSNITDNQWNGLVEASQIKGVIAGVICWWVDKDVTKFLPIQALAFMCKQDYKSIRYDMSVPDGCEYPFILINGNKKRVFFDYDMATFLVESRNNDRSTRK